MDYKFGYIIERDADFAIIKAFESNKKVRELFLDQLNVRLNEKDLEIEKVYQSLMEQDGESDIVIVLNYKRNRVAIFIEDKIDAEAQTNQIDRYEIRAKAFVESQQLNGYDVFLVCPKSYFTNEKYEKRVRYEDIIECLDPSLEREVLAKAVEGSKNGNKSEEATNFWYSLYEYVWNNYTNDEIEICGSPTGKSARSLWPTFRTPIKGLSIIMKTNSRTVDLEFSGMAERMNVVNDALQRIGVENTVIKTGKSASLQIPISEENVIYITSDFGPQLERVKVWLKTVLDLTNVAKELKENNFEIIP